MSIIRSTQRAARSRSLPQEVERLDVKNIRDSKEWFEVLQTGKSGQTAVMRLEPGQSSAKEKQVHRSSDQILFVVEGEVLAEVEDLTVTLRAGDTILVSEGMQHKFSNPGSVPALTLNVYSPPEYPA